MRMYALQDLDISKFENKRKEKKNYYSYIKIIIMIHQPWNNRTKAPLIMIQLLQLNNQNSQKKENRTKETIFFLFS